MATYVNNLRLKEIATGAESGTWGTSTNTNLELIADAFGSGTEAITTNADTHSTTVADGAADEGRAIYMKYTGTLDSACTISLLPNTINKFWIIENATSGSQNIIISQGSGANITIGNGKVAAIFTDGAGSGAAVLDAFADLELSSTLTVAGNVDFNGDLDVDGTTNLDAVDIDGAVQIDSTVTVGVDDTGYDVKFFGDTASAYMLWDTSTDDLVLAGAAGIDLAGDIDVDGTANLDIVDIDGAVDMASTLTLAGNADFNGDLDVDGTTNLDVVDIDGAVDMASTLALASTLDMPDNAKILLGTGDDLEIYHDGSNSYITDSGTGDLIITATTFRPRTDHWIVSNAANSENLLQAVADGAVTLYHNGLAKLATASGGVTVTGTLTATTLTGTLSTAAQTNITSVGTLTALTLSGNLDLQDNDKILLGTGDDLELYHNGSNSFIGEAGTGDLYIYGTNNIYLASDGSGTENYLAATKDGAVTLYHDNSAKLATASGGVTVTGTVVTSGSITSQSGTNLNAILGATSPGPTGLQAQNDSGALIPVAINGSTFTAYTGSNARLTIDANGDVGIGTTSMSAPLQVEIGAPSSADKEIAIFQAEAIRQISLGWDDSLSAMAIGTKTNSYLSFFTNGITNPRMFIDTSGNVGIGVTAIGTALLDPGSSFTVKGTVFSLTNTDGGFSVNNHTAGTTGGTLTFYKSRQGNYDPPATNADDVVNGDTIFSIVGYGYSNSQFNESARMLAQVDGTFTSNQKPPGRFVFQTGVSNGAMTEAMRIDSSQDVNIPNGGLAIGQTTSPSAQLHIKNTSGTAGFMLSRGTIKSSPTMHLSTDSSTNYFDFYGPLSIRGVATATSPTTLERMSIADDGGVHVNLVFTAGTKTFKIDHPLPEKKDTHHLYHSSIEGPKADLIYRGVVELSGGYAQVDLDEAAGMTEGTLEALCRDPQCWIQNDTGWSSVRGSVEGNTLTVECESTDSDDTVSWMVVAERCDPHIMESTITDNDGRLIVEPEKEEEE